MERDLEAVSILPGRVRWRVPLIRDTPGAAEELSAELRAIPDVIDVTANPVTAGVLVFFDERRALDNLTEEIRLRVSALADRHPHRARRKRVAVPEAEPDAEPDNQKQWLRNAAVAGLGLAAVSAVSGTVGTVILWGGAVVAVAAGVVKGVRLAREEASEQDGEEPTELLWRRYGSEMKLPAVTSFFMRVFDLLPPFFVGVAVDILATGSSTWIAAMGITTVGGQLGFLAVTALVAAAISAALEYAQSRLWHRLAQRIRFDLRLEVYRHVQTLDLVDIEGKSSGELLNLFLEDVDKVAQFFDSGANEMMQAFTSVVIPITALFLLPPWLALLTLVPIPLTIASSFFFQRRIAKRYDDVRTSSDRLALELATNLNGMATIKSFTAEERVARQIEATTDAFRRRHEDANAVVAAFNPVMRSWVVLGFDLLLLLAGLFASSTAMSVGFFSAMVYVSLRMWYPLTRLGDDFDEFMHGRAALVRIRALLAVHPAITGGTESFVPAGRGADLAFDGIGFAYPGLPPAIPHVSFSVGAGQTLAIVGPSGSGKTTLAKLLLRFYDPLSGTISIDGRDVRDFSLHSLRSAISLVTQDAYLFHGTIRENIAMGKEGATDEEVKAAARVALAHDFIMAMPRGYDTFVGERGVRLSGGERQRVAIARAVLKDAPILVLDEATSAIDSRTEAALLDALAAATAGRTKLVIAHRLSTVRNAGEIIVLKDGVVWERGDHNALLARDGLYAAFWQLQVGEGVANGE